MATMKDLGLKINSSLVTEVEDRFAVRFGRPEKVRDPDFKPTAKVKKAPMVDNKEPKGDFLVKCLKNHITKILREGRAEEARAAHSDINLG